MTYKMIPTNPYERRSSKAFIDCCKSGNSYDVRFMLVKNRYLIYDFDNVYNI